MGGMSQGEFQNYLGLLGRLLRLRTAQRTEIEEELRAHMEERFVALTSQGIEPEQAVSMALAEFGDAAALAAEFTAISRLQKRRWMMRFTVGSIAATLLLTIAVVSMWPDGSGELASTAAQAQQVEQPAPPKAEKPAAQQDANEQTQAKLEKHIDAEFVETELPDVLDYLAEKAGVQVYVDKRALDDVGLDPSTVPVTIDLKDVPVEMILRLVLGQLDLAYMLDHGVVIVTTPEEVETNLEVRVYRIGDLVEEAVREEAMSGPPVALDDGPRGVGAMERIRYQGEVGTLIELITMTVEPNSWDTVGGNGSIAPYRGTLVISQTYQGHRNVGKLLQDLREALAKQPAPPASSDPAIP